MRNMEGKKTSLTMVAFLAQCTTAGCWKPETHIPQRAVPASSQQQLTSLERAHLSCVAAMAPRIVEPVTPEDGGPTETFVRDHLLFATFTMATRCMPEFEAENYARVIIYYDCTTKAKARLDPEYAARVQVQASPDSVKKLITCLESVANQGRPAPANVMNREMRIHLMRPRESP